MKRLSGPLVILLLLALVVLVAGFWWRVSSARRQTARVLGVLPHVRLGVTDPQAFRQMLTDAGVSAQGWTCPGGTCNYGLNGHNPALQRLHLAPPTEIVIVVDFKDGVAKRITAWSQIGDFGEVARVDVDETDYVRKQCGKPLCFRRENQFDGSPLAVYVGVDADSPDEARRWAFGVNADCLSRIGGCKNAAELFPPILNPPATEPPPPPPPQR